MLGFAVNKSVIDSKAAEAVLAVRDAFDRIETISKWLANNPGSGQSDPLVATYGYTEDDAYALRVYFETMEALRQSNTATADIGRKMTGLA